jgi:stage III sporulation protein AA
MNLTEMGSYRLLPQVSAAVKSAELASVGKAMEILPPDIKRAMMFMPEEVRLEIEEVRLRFGKSCTVFVGGQEKKLCRDGKTVEVSIPAAGIEVGEEHLAFVVEKSAGGSLYTAEDCLKEGYITVAGGHRVGVCGECVTENGKVTTIKNFSSVCVRLAKNAEGISRRCADDISGGKKVFSTLIVSPPMAGKTTLLRDLVRTLSSQGVRVGVADERGELSGMAKGRAQFELGEFSDVLCGAPKAAGAAMLLRCMSPDLIAMDEITEERDIEAVFKIANCGVSVIATAHAEDISDLQRRKTYSRLLDAGIFERIIEVRRNGRDRYAKVFCVRRENSG